jgi:hypothetical protein
VAYFHPQAHVQRSRFPGRIKQSCTILLRLSGRLRAVGTRLSPLICARLRLPGSAQFAVAVAAAVSALTLSQLREAERRIQELHTVTGDDTDLPAEANLALL